MICGYLYKGNDLNLHGSCKIYFGMLLVNRVEVNFALKSSFYFFQANKEVLTLNTGILLLYVFTKEKVLYHWLRGH